jgi:Holliday junction resolvase RusA-like endonuclease
MIRFTVYGEAQPAGSKRQMPVYRGKKGTRVPTGQTIVVDANPKAKIWKEQVAREAARAMNGARLLDGPVRLDVTFYRVRPKGQLRADGQPRPSAPTHPTSRPDRTKLLRGLEDAMTGIVWRDDSQVCSGETRKEFGESSRVEVVVSTMPELDPALKPSAPLFAYLGSC